MFISLDRVLEEALGGALLLAVSAIWIRLPKLWVWASWGWAYVGRALVKSALWIRLDRWFPSWWANREARRVNRIQRRIAKLERWAMNDLKNGMRQEKAKRDFALGILSGLFYLSITVLLGVRAIVAASVELQSLSLGGKCKSCAIFSLQGSSWLFYTFEVGIISVGFFGFAGWRLAEMFPSVTRERLLNQIARLRQDLPS